jgi:hypothetical protein
MSGTETVTVSMVIISTDSSIANSLFGAPVPTVPSLTPVSPSDLHAATTTNSFGEVESEEVGMSGSHTVTVSESIISTVSSVANSLFGTSVPTAPPATAAASSGSDMTPAGSTSGCNPPSGSPLPFSTSCDLFILTEPTKTPKPNFLNCAFDTNPSKVDYDTVNYDDPIEGKYWLNPKALWPRNTSSDDTVIWDPTYDFCFRMMGPASPFIVGPAGGVNPDGAGPPFYRIYSNTVRASWPNLGAVIGYGNWSIFPIPWLTYSVTWDAAACPDNSHASSPLYNDLSAISVDECYNTFQRMQDCHSDANPRQLNGDYIPTPGGAYWNSCLVWTVGSQEGYQCNCPAQALQSRPFSPVTTLSGPGV